MKKIIGCLLLSCAVFALASCKKTEKQSVNPVEALKSRGTFVLGLDASFPPLGFRDFRVHVCGKGPSLLFIVR